MQPYLNDLMERASKAYYAGEPILTNEEYDALFGDAGKVGSGEVGEIEHAYPMYSLKKYYEGEGEPPLEGYTDVVKTPKLDGAAVSVLYKDGYFTRGLTRGDGEKGNLITDKLSRLAPLFLSLPYISSTVQVVGEVVADISVPNARNIASGALGLKNIDEFANKCEEYSLTFVAYGIDASFKTHKTYLEDLKWLKLMGFATVLDCDADKFPLDGYVYRINNNATYKGLGHTAKHPRGAYAEKTRDIPVETTLVDVIWQTGKTGKVTPVAILEPVVIDAATITRATLNNYAYIQAMNLEIGCKVKVIRAGKIIPCIVGRVD